MIKSLVDWEPYRPFMVGFDSLWDKLNTLELDVPNYPPYNIRKIDDLKYTIDLALAGFGKKDIKINYSDNSLTIKSIKDEGKKVVSYGATSKSTTVFNYCGIGPDLISYITDTTPEKQGKLSPGMHIPIRNYNRFEKSSYKYVFLFAWNHKKEILDKEKKFSKNGGKWIFPVVL